MKFMLDAQTAGSLIVVSAFAVSEASARLLSLYPSSAFAWYLNLELFHPFARVRTGLTPLSWLFGPASFGVALVLIALILVARMIRFRFAVALFANLSFLFTAFLAYSWSGAGDYQSTASLIATGSHPRPGGGLVAVMIAASLAAVLISHVSFAVAIRQSRQVSDAA